MGRGQGTISDGVRGAILALIIGILLFAGNDTLLALVAGLAPLAFTGRENRQTRTSTDELEEFRERLHVIQSDAWRRRRPGRRVAADDWWGIADVPVPLLKERTDTLPPEPSGARDRKGPVRLPKFFRSFQKIVPGQPKYQDDTEPYDFEEFEPESVRPVLEALAGGQYNLVLRGPQNSAKTGTLLGFVLAAQQMRNEDRSFPLAIRVSLAGWEDHWREHPSGPDTLPGLIDWIKVRFRDDYPGLLEHGTPADDLFDALWRDDSRAGGNTVVLFVDDIDRIESSSERDRIIAELGTRTALLTHAEDADPDTWPGRWVALDLTRPTLAYARAVLPGEVQQVPRRIYESPRLLRTLRSAYPKADDLEHRLKILNEQDRHRPARSRYNGGAVDEFWKGLIHEGWEARPQPAGTRRRTGHSHLWHGLASVGRPVLEWFTVRWFITSPPPPARQTAQSPAVRTLKWVARAGLFENTRFAWWEVPRRAAQEPGAVPPQQLWTASIDQRRPYRGGLWIQAWRAGSGRPLITAAYRRLLWRRALSATAWATGTFLAGLLVIGVCLWLGLVQGYDRASHGLQGAGVLTWSDVAQWDWRSRHAPLTNPLYLSASVLFVVVLTVFGLARFGEEFEHSDGGRPQIIRPRLPGGRQLREIARLIPAPSAVLLAIGIVSAVVLRVMNSGLSEQLWTGTAFSALFVFLLAWLHWCSQEGDNLTPTDTFASDRRSTRVVASTLGLAMIVSSTALAWWFTSPGHVPTLGQCLWISGAAAVSVGLARGFYLGAGMIAPILFPLREGFGIGYAHRMRMLEISLRRIDDRRAAYDAALARRARNLDPPAAADAARSELAPLTVISAFDLNQRASWDDERHRGLVLRHVGSLIRLRDVTLERYLAPEGKDPDTASPHTSRWRQAIVFVSLLTAVLSLTGTAAVVVPRALCAPFQDTFQNPVRSLNTVPTAQTWLENGQCVGFDTLVGDGNQFDSAIEPNGEPEAERDEILADIQQQNAAIPSSQRAVNVLFLAPLSRTPQSRSINALYQLRGAQAAQADINAAGSVYVRLTIANVGEDFTSGPAVVQMIDRQFPSDPRDPNSIKAVIGIAQSRAAAREALSQFDDVTIVASSVNGNGMRHGLVSGQDVDLGKYFVSVAPSNLDVARAMLSAPVLDWAGKALGPQDPGSAPRPLKIILDDRDTFFSNDLAGSLEFVGETQDDADFAEPIRVNLRETASDRRYDDLAEDLCSLKNAQTVWLFAGRGNQLARLGESMGKGCVNIPTIIAGPGALSAVQGTTPKTMSYLAKTRFYSLVAQSSGEIARGTTWSAGVARSGDRATGWAALVEAYRRVAPSDISGCPEPASGVPQIAVSIPGGSDGDGHNTLQPSLCTPEATPIYWCPVLARAPVQNPSGMKSECLEAPMTKPRAASPAP
ncbi:hypothetical protein [Kineosporia sp. NBRC 101731]|uniref:hypothetical protein n=1 Tax=Kineosporia sp. NBRC 101731 TaxID=3032199 RepID=UPI0024A52259|nr:hypothetical protein [Kineosporia sp. NBRC 101731]GLY26742.1 hypothetical protein Kisp02_01070 [Kineosporia sp. NBRC 101731]